MLSSETKRVHGFVEKKGEGKLGKDGKGLGRSIPWLRGSRGNFTDENHHLTRGKKVIVWGHGTLPQREQGLAVEGVEGRICSLSGEKRKLPH